MPTAKRSLSALMLAGAVIAASSQAAPAEARDTLIVGSVSRSIKEEIETFRPLTEYLGPRLRAAGIADVEIAVVTTTGEMARRLASGEIDIYIDSPFVVAQISRRAGARPFLRRWKKGVAEYHSLFVTHRDAGIGSLDDLRGKVIAFDDPHSSSGYLLPKAMLLQRGYRLIQVQHPDDYVPADAIGYVFSMDDINTMFWVDRGKVAGGVTSPSFLEKFSKKHQNDLVVIERSSDIPRHVVAHRADLDPQVLDHLQTVLVGMEHDQAGREALQAFQKTTRFDHFPSGVEATFAPIHAMLDVLEQAPGLTN